MKQYLVNDKIRETIINLIDADGTNRGKFGRLDAIKRAREQGLDLVQVSESTPPVCKIADYGKLRYKDSKSEKKGHSNTQKECWLHNDTAEHDWQIKVNKILEWIRKGHRVRVVVKLEGREKYHRNFRDMASDRLAKFVALHTGKFTHSPIANGDKDVSVVLQPA
jgi:translation initiation factor IF-3